MEHDPNTPDTGIRYKVAEEKRGGGDQTRRGKLNPVGPSKQKLSANSGKKVFLDRQLF